MPWTEAQRDTLAAAIASGILTVTFNGRSTTYQSLEQMRALLAEMTRDLAATSAPYYAYRLAATSKGV